MADRVYEVVLAVYALAVTVGFWLAMSRWQWWAQRAQYWRRAMRVVEREFFGARRETQRWAGQAKRLAGELADANDELDRLRQEVT